MLRVFIRKDWVGELGVSIFGVGNTVNFQWLFGKPEMKQYQEGYLSPEPSFTVPRDLADGFIIALKEAIRIYEGTTPDFSQGELEATKYHLEDLRKLLNIKP